MPKSIVVIGRRWFQKTYGNTYHSAEIFVDGQKVHYIDYTYGYGDQYLYNARNWLRDNGYLPGIKDSPGTPGEALWRYCERNGIIFTYSAINVQRKKDL
jgi:hypothetical protein